jgi:hypothetical protein
MRFLGRHCELAPHPCSHYCGFMGFNSTAVTPSLAKIMGKIPPSRPRTLCCRRVLGCIASGACSPGGSVDQEDAELAVVLRDERATRLRGHSTRLGPRLGDGAEGEDRRIVAERLAEVAAQFGHDGLLGPSGGTDEKLDPLTVEARLDGDRFGGARQASGLQERKDSVGVKRVRDPSKTSSEENELYRCAVYPERPIWRGHSHTPSEGFCASVRRHRRVPQPGRTSNQQGAPPSWLVSDSQGRRW